MDKNKFGPARPLAREDMPTDFSISLDNYFGRNDIGCGYFDGEIRIPEEFGPDQSMTNFEETYKNIIDYIIRITFKIWEDRDVGYIAKTYSAESNVYDDYGLQRGNKKIIADTHHTTGAFSNIRLIADEVIWAGNDKIGYHTSHRTLIRGTNDGDSRYGPATGKQVDILVIANCVAKDNIIFLEHVLYNNSSQIQQLGLNLNEMAINMAAEPAPGWPRDTKTWNNLREATNPGTPISVSDPISGFDPDAFARRTFTELWNNKSFDILETNYAADFSFEGTTNVSFSGTSSYSDYLGKLFRTFPNLELTVDEVYWMGNDKDGYLTSERWSATATHTGSDLYGEPTNAEVQIWGITQHKIINGGIVSEWMLFNELDLMMQIADARKTS